MINQIKAAVSAMVQPKAPAPVTAAPRDQVANKATVDKTAKETVDKASFSTLASQLNESTARAAKRDASMTHAELGVYGRGKISEFMVESPKANSFTRAMEVPTTNDPELLDRARDASAFVTRTMAGDKHAKGPFENLSREQLNVIAYDDSGAFTLNERRTAWHGVQKMDEAWRKVAIPQGLIEQARTGKASKFYQQALSYLNALPAIEKAVSYPDGAEAILKGRIKSSPTLPSLPGLPGISGRQGADRKLTLYDILAGIVDSSRDKKSDPANPVHTRKFSPRASATPPSAAHAVDKKDAPKAKEKPVAPTVVSAVAPPSDPQKAQAAPSTASSPKATGA
jgi:hypothetical protein